MQPWIFMQYLKPNPCSVALSLCLSKGIAQASGSEYATPVRIGVEQEAEGGSLIHEDPKIAVMRCCQSCLFGQEMMDWRGSVEKRDH
jgi:hypothetical protein